MSRSIASRSRRPSKTARAARVFTTVLSLLGFVVVFAGGVFLFRSSAAERRMAHQQETESAANVAGETPGLDAHVENANATLRAVRGEAGEGMVERQIVEGRYVVSFQATLPAIDRQTTAYRAWLLRRQPFSFLPIGEFVTDENGTFVLSWEGKTGTDYGSYDRVVVTRNAKTDGPEDPGVHVLEGEFARD